MKSQASVTLTLTVGNFLETGGETGRPLLLLFCVYLDCQIARPSFWMGATLCCDWAIRGH